MRKVPEAQPVEHPRLVGHPREELRLEVRLSLRLGLRLGLRLQQRQGPPQRMAPQEEQGQPS